MVINELLAPAPQPITWPLWAVQYFFLFCRLRGPLAGVF